MKTRLALLLCVAGASGYAQSTGTFTATGSMITPRVSHTATLLSNGKVLIAGGYSSSTPEGPPFSVAGAELYDPSTGKFSATGALNKARFLHSATLLADGRVLIAGGYASFPNKQPLASAEIYDPSTGMFTAIGEMLAAGTVNTTLLADGRVLIAHDLLYSPGPPATAEIYDAFAETFSATADQQVISVLGELNYQTAALLPDGRVILVSCCTQIQLYDPARGDFQLTNVAKLLRNGEQNFRYTMTLLTNGKLLLSGGCFCDGNAGDPVSSSAGLYDPSTGAAGAIGSMTTPRSFHSATLLPDGTVLIAGPDATAELYGPATSVFSRTGDMTSSRFAQTATLLLDGRVLMAGGFGIDNYLEFAELYTPATLVRAPVLFSLSGDGKGQGAIWHSSTGQIAAANNPAVAGEALSMYTTSLASNGLIPPQVAIGGRLAEVLYFGDAPGYPGYYQVNVRVPSGVVPGAAVPVHLTYLGRPSNEVTIGVQ